MIPNTLMNICLGWIPSRSFTKPFPLILLLEGEGDVVELFVLVEKTR